MSDVDVKCANPECRVAQDGKCVEGLTLDKCQFYGRDREEIEVAVDEEATRPKPPADSVQLAPGITLAAAGACSVLQITQSRVVGIVGTYDSGKTSVIAGLYDLFQEGPVAGVEFAGSSTLHGLELICHDARAASKRNVAHSPRTNRGEVRFYHLDVRPPGAALLSLLIADRSGEEYEEVADLASNAAGMFELRRADVVTILVDGRRLCMPATRADTIGAIPLIVQGLVESGAFPRCPRLAIVLTKDDAVRASSKAERALRDLEEIATGIRERFSGSFREMRSFVTCASPRDPKAKRGEGLDALLDFWLTAPAAPVEFREAHLGGRVFDRLHVEEDRDGE